MKMQYTLDGSGELERKFRQVIPLAASDRVITSALRQAARPMLLRMKQLAPVGKGHERSSLSNRQRRGGATKADIRIRAVKDKEGEAKILIGVSKAPGKVGKRTHFIVQGIAGKGRARIGPRDFITQAYNQTVVETNARFQSIMLKKVESAFARYGLK